MKFDTVNRWTNVHTQARYVIESYKCSLSIAQQWSSKNWLIWTWTCLGVAKIANDDCQCKWFWYASLLVTYERQIHQQDINNRSHYVFSQRILHFILSILIEHIVPDSLINWRLNIQLVESVSSARIVNWIFNDEFMKFNLFKQYR